MNFTTTHIRSEKVTIDTRIYTILNGRKKPGEVYLAAIAPDMELTIITLDEAPGILPCFEEDDACLNLPNTSLLLCYNPAQVLKMGGKHYLTGPVILVRTNMDGDVISLTIDEVSGKPQHHPDGRRPEAALHLHGVRCAMLNFFIGFAFFEAGAFFGFFVAALLNAAHAGQEISIKFEEDDNGTEREHLVGAENCTGTVSAAGRD